MNHEALAIAIVLVTAALLLVIRQQYRMSRRMDALHKEVATARSRRAETGVLTAVPEPDYYRRGFGVYLGGAGAAALFGQWVSEKFRHHPVGATAATVAGAAAVAALVWGFTQPRGQDDARPAPPVVTSAPAPSEPGPGPSGTAGGGPVEPSPPASRGNDSPGGNAPTPATIKGQSGSPPPASPDSAGPAETAAPTGPGDPGPTGSPDPTEPDEPASPTADPPEPSPTPTDTPTEGRALCLRLAALGLLDLSLCLG